MHHLLSKYASLFIIALNYNYSTSSNPFGTFMCQLNEMWPTGGLVLVERVSCTHSSNNNNAMLGGR